MYPTFLTYKNGLIMFRMRTVSYKALQLVIWHVGQSVHRPVQSDALLLYRCLVCVNRICTIRYDIRQLIGLIVATEPGVQYIKRDPEFGTYGRICKLM